MGLGHLGAGSGDLLDGQEASSLSAVHQIPCGAFAQAGDGHKGRQDLAVLDEELGGMAFVEGNGCEFKAPEVEFVDHFQGSQQILVLGGGILVAVDGFDIGFYCVFY